MAQGGIVPPGSGDKDQIGHQARDDHAPDGGARQVGMAGLHQGERLERVADAQVAIHADAGEEEDAAVEVDVEQEAHDFAGRHPERPVAVVGVVVDQRGQREDVQEVRQGEVEHEDGGGVPRSHLQEEPQSRGVEQEADDKHQTVGDGQEDVFEALIKATPVGDDGGVRGAVVPVQNAVGGIHRGVSAQSNPAKDKSMKQGVHLRLCLLINTFRLSTFSNCP